MDLKCCDHEVIDASYYRVTVQPLLGVTKAGIRIEACPLSLLLQEQNIRVSRLSSFAILYAWYLEEQGRTERATILALNEKPDHQPQKRARHFRNLFGQSELDSTRKHAKAGAWGLVWWLILTIMALCGNITGTVEFAQLAGQGLGYLTRLF